MTTSRSCPGRLIQVRGLAALRIEFCSSTSLRGIRERLGIKDQRPIDVLVAEHDFDEFTLMITNEFPCMGDVSNLDAVDAVEGGT